MSCSQAGERRASVRLAVNIYQPVARDTASGQEPKTPHGELKLERTLLSFANTHGSPRSIFLCVCFFLLESFKSKPLHHATRLHIYIYIYTLTGLQV